MVRHGRVEVRAAHQPFALLVAGESWTPPALTHDTPAPKSTATSARRDPAAVAFDDGWHALRAGDPKRAAISFAAAAEAAPSGPLAEDARFWHAVALGRARDDQARGALEAFLIAYPSSAHAGEASVMLGWILLDAGDRDGAARRFESAGRDRSERVRDGAARGLTAVRRDARH
jgi:TolA-binding protein